MAVVLFIIYLIACCFFLLKVKFIRNSGLTSKTIIVLFLIRVATGCLMGFVNHYFLHDRTDYDVYNRLGLMEHHNLFHDPHLFFTDIFRSNYSEYGEFFGTKGSYWNDLRENILLKILGLMNIFSRGNYFINSLFFNFLCFFGNIALYRVFAHIYQHKKTAVIIGCFLLPSMLYFTSGIHKDLIVFTALGIFSYCIYYGLTQGFSAKKISFLLFSFLTVLLTRNFVALILLPCAITFCISCRSSLHPLKVFAGMLVILFAGISSMHFVTPEHDPLKVVVAKQQAFFALQKAETQYVNDTLEASVKSFAVAMPRAVRHSFLSPYPGEFSSGFMNLFSGEMMIYALLFIAMLLFSFPGSGKSDPFIVFGIVFSCLILLFIGYITPAAGALVRYRSIYLPFLITPVLASINWKKC